MTKDYPTKYRPIYDNPIARRVRENYLDRKFNHFMELADQDEWDDIKNETTIKSGGSTSQ